MAHGNAAASKVVWRGENGYEQLRRSMVWNAYVPDRFPEGIFGAFSKDDVAEAVELARGRELRVSIRSGGHSWIGASLRDDSLLIDLSGMNALVVDAGSITASLEPGVTNGQLAEALHTHRLGFPIGHSSTVGLGGYLLGGGLGWNPGVWGSAAANVTAVEVVAADGTRVRADEHVHPELFWAARGSGPGFPGIVTRFHLRLHPLPGAITGSTYVYPLADTEAVATWLTEVLPAQPPELELAFILRSGPPAGAAWAGAAAVVAPTVFAETLREAADVLAAFETCPVSARALVADTMVPISYGKIQGRAYLPEGHRYAVDTIWSNSELPEVASKIARHLLGAPSPKSAVVGTLTPPAPAADTAFRMTGSFNMSCYTIWEDPAEDRANAGWLRDLMSDLDRFSVGQFIPEADLTVLGADPARSFTLADWQRLQAVRTQTDPDGLFHGFLAGEADPVSARA